MKKRKIIFRILFVFLILILGFMIFNISHKVKTFKTHHEYFELDPQDKHIEGWMTIRMIENDFKIKINKALDIKIGLFEKRDTLEDFCNSHNLEINNTIERLENERINNGNNKNKK